MKKADIINKIVKATNLTKAEADEAMTAFLGAVKEGLKDRERVTIIGFGSFSVVERKARMGRNPQTGEEIRDTGIQDGEVYAIGEVERGV